MATYHHRGRRPDSAGDNRSPSDPSLIHACASGAHLCLTAAEAFQCELTHFWASRTHRNIATGKALMACRDWPAMSRTQSQWAKLAAQDYAEQSGRLLGLAFDLWRSNAQPFECMMPPTRPF